MRTHIFVLGLSLSSGSVFADEVDTSPCVRDARLASAASAALDDPQGFEASELRALALGAGLRAPAVHALVLRGGDQTSRGPTVSRWLAERAGAGARCLTETRGEEFVLVTVPRLAEVRDESAVEGTHTWQVTLPTGVSEAVLVGSPSEGETLRVAVGADGRVSMPIDPQRSWTMQVMATLPDGPAAFATWNEGAADTPAPNPPMSNERQLFGAINALRRARGVDALRRDPLLDQVATQHAERLAVTQHVVHTPMPGDSPVDRLRRRGISTPRVAENLARARTLSQAHSNLSRSPSHRANILNADLDAVGIGVARVSGMVYLVELFATRPSLTAARGD